MPELSIAMTKSTRATKPGAAITSGDRSPTRSAQPKSPSNRIGFPELLKRLSPKRFPAQVAASIGDKFGERLHFIDAN